MYPSSPGTADPSWIGSIAGVTPSDTAKSWSNRLLDAARPPPTGPDEPLRSRPEARSSRASRRPACPKSELRTVQRPDDVPVQSRETKSRACPKSLQSRCKDDLPVQSPSCPKSGRRACPKSRSKVAKSPRLPARPRTQLPVHLPAIAPRPAVAQRSCGAHEDSRQCLTSRSSLHRHRRPRPRQPLRRDAVPDPGSRRWLPG